VGSPTVAAGGGPFIFRRGDVPRSPAQRLAADWTAKLAPLFSRYQVDLAVQGHNHVYERTNPLIYDAKTNSARSSKQAVALSPQEPAEIAPAKDGTTYVGGGHRGHTPLRLDRRARDRPQLQGGQGQRHDRGRGRQDADRAVRQRARLQHDPRDRRLVAGAVRRPRLHRARRHPGRPRSPETMVLRFINEQGRELDRAVFSRTAGDVLH
jgi:hypothetical protein